MVAISAIRPNGFNPRKHFDETSLNELADSIRQQGMLQPVTVRPAADGNGYELVFGERRYRAATIVGMQEIPAIISDLSDEEAEEIAITENLQRKDVTPMEEANAYQRLMESGRHDLSSLSVQFGKSEAYIRTRLKFASLIPEIATLLETDEITVSVASEIAVEKTIEDTKKQILNIDVAEAKFGADEDRMVYFFLLSSLRKENFAQVGLSEEHMPYLSDKEKMDIIANLTAKTKAVIRRDYLIAQFKDASRNSATAELLLDFARKHMPDELAEIEDGYNQIYEKRHQRLEERKAAIVAKEKPTEEDGTAEPSPEDAKPEDAAA